jgi:sugar O-acyltransferase (sialic acid O-acetyltransferase NeuD family)
MVKIVIIGGGGHAKVVISIVKKLNLYEIDGYVDKIDKGQLLGIEYLGGDDILPVLFNRDKTRYAAIGIGQLKDSSLRRKISQQLIEIGYKLPPIISPSAIINEDVEIGDGSVVMDGVIVNPGTIIGRFTILNTKSSIDHDCKIGDFVHIAPGVTLSGGVKVGNNCLIGVGASVIQYKTIVSDCTIGAGAVVTKDCLKAGYYLGVPAKEVT